MTMLPFDQYVKALRQSGLVTNEQLAALLKEFEAEVGPPPADSSALADWLLKKGTITTWQNGKLSQGMYKGFFLGKYKLLKHIGSGGMSSVYLGEHVLMRRHAAIKILPKARVDDSSYLERFFLEARAIAALDHPNIVRAYNLNNEGNLYYIVMEFVQGEDLEKRVLKSGPLPYDEALDYVRQAADGLQHAHERKMIHRDIKPSNLLLDDTGTVKILDMGLAKLTADDRSLTREHNERVLGTTDYLAPEQAIDSASVDSRADLYSLGCTLYFLLTGRPPFPDGTLAQRLMKHQVEEPKPVTDFRPDCPQEVVDICTNLMVKRRDERFQTAQEVSEATAETLQNVFGRQMKRPMPRASAPVGDATVQLNADDTHFGRSKGSGSGSGPRPGSGLGAGSSTGSGPRVTSNTPAPTRGSGVAATAVRAGSSTQRAPAAGPPAMGSTLKAAAASEATEMEGIPELVADHDDSSPSSQSAPAYSVAPKPWFMQPPVMIGAGLVLLVMIAGMIFMLSGKSSKSPTAHAGRIEVPFTSIPIGDDFHIYVRVSQPGMYNLTVNVKKAPPGSTAKVKLGANVLSENLPVGNAQPHAPASFNLGKHMLHDDDNVVLLTLNRGNAQGNLDFSVTLEPAK